MFFVTQPERFDVMVTDNLFGDILTDLGAAVAGGIGLAASGNINPERTAPSMFEPVHGSAPDIAGQQKADPTAAILSAAMLCEHLGLAAEAARIEQAVADDLVERQGAWAARVTPEIGDDIAAPGGRLIDTLRSGRRRLLRPGNGAPPAGAAAPGTGEGPCDDGKPEHRDRFRRPRQRRSVPAGGTRACPGRARGSARYSPITWSRSAGRRSGAGMTARSSRTARSCWTRPPRCSTTPRRSSRG